MPSQSRTLQSSSVRWYYKCCFTFMQVIVKLRSVLTACLCWCHWCQHLILFLNLCIELKLTLVTTVISDVILILQTLLLQSKTLVRCSQVCSTGTLWEETLAYKRVHLGQSGLTTAPMELIGREVR